MLGELFDPKADVLIDEHCRPHWSQAGAVVFITFRTADSIPRIVIERWDREQREWLAARGYDAAHDCSQIVATLSEKDLLDFRKHFDRCREEYLDTCQGR